MELREYLFRNKITVKKFAELLDYSIVTISAISNGRIKPGAKLARYIEKQTNGAVMTDDLIATYKQKSLENLAKKD